MKTNIILKHLMKRIKSKWKESGKKKETIKRGEIYLKAGLNCHYMYLLVRGLILQEQSKRQSKP